MPKLAVLGGEPIRAEKYPDWPVYGQNEIDWVTRAVKSGRWGGFPFPGPFTEEFAHRFIAMQGGNYAIPMANGAVTMEVALRAAEIGWGDEVIIPAYTFQASAAGPMAAGALPVFVDINPENYCLNPIQLERAITAKTKAVIVVHIGAQMADMDAILEIAKKYNLVVIEDSAHAHGASWCEKGAGTIGDFGSFSFQSAKSLTTGEGGLLICKDKKMSEKVASIIDCGRPKDPDGGEYTMGINYRMTELQAALGLAALDRFPDQLAERGRMADYLEEQLKELPGINLLKKDTRLTRRSLYRYIFNIDTKFFNCTNSVFCKTLTHEGIPADTGYPAMHQYDLFKPQLSKLPVPSAFPEYFNFEKMSFPIAERASLSEAVWIGEKIFRAGEKGIDDLIAGINKIIENRDDLKSFASKEK